MVSESIKKVFFLYLLILTGCGIFSPRDEFEKPSKDSTKEDSFNFSSLIGGTGYRFSNPGNLNELFSDDFFYKDINSGEHVRYTKNRLITCLEQLKIDSVVWSKGNGERRIQGDSIFINNFEYSVFIPGVYDLAAYSGISNFRIVKIDMSWYIASWTDIPSSEAKSFFAPLD